MVENVTKWFIAYKKRGSDIFNLDGLERWETPKGQYEADPFLLKHKGVNYLFYELYDYKKGVIAYSTITDKGISEPTVCLEEDHHLSYPCVFKDGDQIYMVPEMGASQKIVLYKATDFPKKWEPVNTILDGYQVEDNNVFFYKDSWWMMTSQSGRSLLIMRANRLEGKWKIEGFLPHQRNCRGAGRVFEHKEMLVRPTQDSSKMYGRAVIFNEIELPNYSGEAFDRIEPDFLPDIKGVHTFNFNEDYVVVDCKTKV